MLLVRVFRHPIVCFKKGAVFDIFFMIAVGTTSPDSVAGEGCYPLFLWYLLQDGRFSETSHHLPGSLITDS